MSFQNVDGIRLEHFLEFKYLGCVLDKSGKDGSEFIVKVKGGRRVAGAIRSLVNASNFQLECARVLAETLLVPGSYIWQWDNVMEGEGEV